MFFEILFNSCLQFRAKSTDAWDEQVPKLREAIAKHINWAVVQSNPCFEVWLYYHFYAQKPTKEITDWKAFLNVAVPGSFDSRKHICYVLQATDAAEANFSATNGTPNWATTEIFRLIQSFRPFIEEKLLKDLFLKSCNTPQNKGNSPE